MNPDDFPLSGFEVDCDGSACGSGRDVGWHVHPPQDGLPAFGRVAVRDHRRVSYGPAEGITRLLCGGPS
jgi:hypothetical protein